MIFYRGFAWFHGQKWPNMDKKSGPLGGGGAAAEILRCAATTGDRHQDYLQRLEGAMGTRAGKLHFAQ